MLDVTAHLYPSRDFEGLMWDLWFPQRYFFVFGSPVRYDTLSLGQWFPTYLTSGRTRPTTHWHNSQCSQACRDEGCDVRYKYSATANALVRQAKRLNMQCGTDCSTVECNPTIMLVLLMGRWDFTCAGGKTGKASPPKRTGSFTECAIYQGVEYLY